jgi:hypothetical protein
MDSQIVEGAPNLVDLERVNDETPKSKRAK